MSAFRESSLAAQLAAQAAPRAASAFAVLDDVVQVAGASGVVRVLLREGTIAPLARHLSRRASQAHRPVTLAGVSPVADPWREVALRVGALGTSEPAAVARSVARAAAGGVLVVAQRAETSWGRTMAEQLQQLALEPQHRVLLIVLRERASRRAFPQSLHGQASLAPQGEPDLEQPLDLTLELDAINPEDTRRWWDGVVACDELLSQPPLDRLDSLDRWWEATRAGPTDPEPAIPSLSAQGHELLAYAMRAQEALTPQQADALTSSTARQELIAQGLLTADRTGRLSPREGARSATAPTAALDERLAAVLVDAALGPWPQPDPWVSMRSAELYVAAGRAEQAEQLAFQALSKIPHAAARDDLWARWVTALETLQGDSTPPEHLDRLVRSARWALQLSDCDRADDLARQAMALDGERFDVLALRGRASATRGDLTTASLSLLRALSRAADDEQRAQAAAVMAEVRYLSGDHDEAQRFAGDAVGQASRVTTRLDARNVIGKLLLGQGEFAQAEEHFAADAYDAAQASELECELRARLNRAIAVLSQGQRDEARRMFADVQADGEKHESLRAVAYALANLATIAIMELSFQEALSLSERAIEVRHQLGERMGLVRPITNLAELRLRLGLVDEAEQALRFGLQACGHNLPAARYAYFALVSARVHLARGNTDQALAQLGVARSGAACSGDGGMVGECERLAVRIALEDGDLSRAELSLETAREQTSSAAEHPELLLLDGMVQRALGQPFADTARQALRFAQRSDDPEFIREAHVLRHHAARLEGDDAAALRHLEAAAAELGRVADSLPPELRSRLFARSDLVELSELEAGAAAPLSARDAQGAPSVQPATERKPADRVMVGEGASMRALRGAISRVGKTDATVLVQGETGAGKELVAEAIHRASDRARGPLVTVNCAALVETLLLSELFGHERGAFTGASSRRRGRFELAEGGTLFLDEIGDISPRTQVALLRVLQDGSFERVGGSTTLRADVRILCATHRDLKAMVERGEFREDLYYRLCGVVLEVPPLRDRLGDLTALSQTLLRQEQHASGIEPKALSREATAALSRHSWPGNVRELQNALRVAALFAQGAEIQLVDFTENVEGLRHLADQPSSASRLPTMPPAADSRSTLLCAVGAEPSPETLPSGAASLAGGAGSSDMVYAEVRGGTSLAEMKRKLERECIARALIESSGNITRAAALLGMKRPRLSQLVKQYELGSVLEEMKS